MGNKGKMSSNLKPGSFLCEEIVYSDLELKDLEPEVGDLLIVSDEAAITKNQMFPEMYLILGNSKIFVLHRNHFNDKSAYATWSPGRDEIFYLIQKDKVKVLKRTKKKI